MHQTTQSKSEKRSREMKVARIRVEINELNEEKQKLVQSEQYAKAEVGHRGGEV